MDETNVIEEEAAAWLAAIECGTADRVAFENWRAQSPANAVAFVRVQHAWTRADAALHAGVAPLEPVRAASRLSRRAFAKAAMVVVAAGIGGTLFATRSQAETVTTGIGERRRLFIAPETCIDLNTATSVRWQRTGKGFAINLDRGEVSLLLAPDSPLCMLRAGDAEARFVQGDFNIRMHGRDTEIATVRGEAQLLVGTVVHALPPQRRLDFSAARRTIRPMSDAQVAELTAWRQGELLFNGQSLREAVSEYNRYLAKPMVLDDPSLDQKQLGGRFLTSNPDAFISALATNFGVQATRGDGKIHLRRLP